MKNKILAIILAFVIAIGIILPDNFLYAQNDVKPLYVRTRSSAKNITSSTAVLDGSVDPNGLQATAWFEWGPAYSGLDFRTDFQNIGSGERSIYFLAGLSNLSLNSVYFYRAVVKNQNGTFYGSTESLKTKSAPKEPNSVFRSFKTSSAEVVEGGPFLMTVNISADKIKVSRDEIFVLNITYRNLGTIDTDNVVLIITLPKELGLDIVAPLCYTKNEDTLRFNLGRISAGEVGAVGLRVKTSPVAHVGKELVIDANLKYEDLERIVGGKALDSLVIVVSSQISGTAAAGIAGLTGGAMLWFIVSLLLLAFLIGHIYYTRRKIKILLS